MWQNHASVRNVFAMMPGTGIAVTDEMRDDSSGGEQRTQATANETLVLRRDSSEARELGNTSGDWKGHWQAVARLEGARSGGSTCDCLASKHQGDRVELLMALN
ncbi:hypothetical protein E2562_004451 [Oryza meyeriana var. granulata]|uniref:Uncharacterized protein n=1 Tax=Oryza meyeriana var. granulata TaxID=110450 RepID=A0A6G1CZ69_9ORYZ|nr:hypothetical protein E2562_004451 [Oryza meyeriana var. granulata]